MLEERHMRARTNETGVIGFSDFGGIGIGRARSHPLAEFVEVDEGPIVSRPDVLLFPGPTSA